MSGRRTTLFFPSFSGLFATSIAAESAHPDEIPTRKPSTFPVILPAATVTVRGERPLPGVVATLPPHLLSKEEEQVMREVINEFITQ